MNTTSIPPAQATLSENDINKAASEFLSMSSDRRKRSRASLAPNNSADHARKRGPSQSINVESARKSALDLMQESASFKRLVELEEQLDLAIMRKQQAIREVLKADTYSESRIFRLYIFNTYRSQPGTEGVTSDDVASWSLRIQGKLLQKGDTGTSDTVPPAFIGNGGNRQGGSGTAGGQSGASGNASGAGGQFQGAANGTNLADVQQQQSQLSVITGAEPRCSDIFSRIVVELDKEVYPTNNVIEWKRTERESASDGFEISRAGSQEFLAKIFLFVDHKPTRFHLSTELARLIGTQYETKSGVFSSIWQYVKKHRLQCVDNRAAVRLDAGLKTLLGPANAHLEAVKAQSLFALMKNHMGPAEPLKIEYEIRLSGDVVDNQDCYDIHVNVADMSIIESARKAGVFGLSLSHSSEFEALNERHLHALEKIAHHKKRREFFEGFCANPVQFINHLILSQTRDLKVLGGSTGRNPEEERHAAFYQQQWVHEAVPRYLLRKAIADTAEDTMETGLKASQ